MDIVIVDTNLLMLFVVGITSPDYIAKHKRLGAYTVADFNFLAELLLQSSRLIVTPNVLTETSNLLGHIQEPARSEIFASFRVLIQSDSTEERHYSSSGLVDRAEFIRLGLADVSLLAANSNSGTLLTGDVGVYIAALSEGYQAVNFNHLREAAGLV